MVGASVAWHLARAGVRDVLVLDAAPGPAQGSTGAATGGYRAQFATAINVRLSLLSRGKLLAFREETGVDPGYLPAGYLWLAETAGQMDALAEARRVQHAEGLHEAIEVGPDDVRRLQPAVAVDGIVGGAFCPTDGFIKPRSILEGCLAAAERMGVSIRWSEEVTGFDVGRGGAVSRVMTSRGTVACEAVVNAAGAWAGKVARLAGIELPVTPVRRHLAPTVPTQAVPTRAPMTLYCGDGFHFRERDGRVLMGWPGRDLVSFDTTVDPEWVAALAALKERRLPALRSIPLDAGAAWVGLYEMSPDKHAILGPAEERGNFYLVNGSSGHGVMHALALGQLAGEMITEGRPVSLDASALSPGRFAAGRPLPSSEIL